MPVRQTQSYLRSLFAQRGIAPRHRMGQNFLIDLNIHELIVEEARVGPDDVILEVGPGAGALTALMAGRGADDRCRRARSGDGEADAGSRGGLSQRPGAQYGCPGEQEHPQPDHDRERR